MNPNTLERLEYHKIIEEIAERTVTYLGRRKVEELAPSTHPGQIRSMLDETEEAKRLVEKSSGIPLPSLEGIEWVMSLLGKGYVLSEKDCSAVGTFLRSLSQLKRFMARWESVAPQVSLYARPIHDYADLAEEIERSVRNGRVADAASPELGKVRKQLMVLEDRLKKKLDALLHKHRGILQETIVSQRGGRYVIPVKKEHRKLVPGAVLDESSSGQTVYVEPAELASLQAEMGEWRFRESTEEQKVLAGLTELLENEQYSLQSDLEIVGHYDFLFAKAKYAAAVGGRKVAWNEEGLLVIRQGRHPLLGQRMVPLDFSLGAGYRALMITGPNTGGKTVALKTVGLLTLMVQSGLLPPVGEGSEFTLYRSVEADIGDGQSLEHSLSTFSAHMKNLIEVLKRADAYTLVLLDELASGTDPGEGIGLSIAVLEELYRRGTSIVATTHYNEIKEFAARTPGFQNARMEFDTETLEPQYRLTIGSAGSSYAFHIALKLGMNPRIVDRSREIANREGIGKEEAGKDRGNVEGEEKRQAIRPHQTGVLNSVPLQMRKTPKPAGSADSAADGSSADPASVPRRGKREFIVGDCVWIHPLKRTGIVYRTADERGIVVVQVQKRKLSFNRKRLSLYIEGEKLYPGEDYDMEIVFETKELRKARKTMSRKHVEGLSVEYKEE